MTHEEILSELRKRLEVTAGRNGLLDQPVLVTARALSAEEAIGNPEHDDYALVIGRERMMAADVRGACGQAFTDMYGCWEGTISEVCRTEPRNNYRRAILVATLNAVMRFAGEIEGTAHCKDDGPVECAGELSDLVRERGYTGPFVLIGYQPRLAETLASLGALRIVDLDERNIGQMRAGVRVDGPEGTDAALAGAGCAFVTGSTVVNGTMPQFLGLPMPTVFYGVTIAGAARVLELTRFCARGL
jgi:hypothetical protein